MIFFLILIKSITCKQRSPGRLEKILKALIISGTNQYAVIGDIQPRECG
jgi:hypothetical protein